MCDRECMNLCMEVIVPVSAMNTVEDQNRMGC